MATAVQPPAPIVHLRPVHDRPASTAAATTTTVVVGESEVRHGGTALVGQLADVATYDELLIVYGADRGTRTSATHGFIDDLRARLPRHDVLGVYVGPDAAAVLRGAALLDDLLEAGSLPVAVTTATAVNAVTAELSSYVRADRVLRAARCRTGGVRLDPVWQRDVPRRPPLRVVR